jgi:hypothetical protein
MVSFIICVLYEVLIKVIKLRRIRQTGHVAHRACGEISNA